MGDAWKEAGADMAKLQASRAFHSAKRRALTLRHRHGEAPRWPLSDMRNAWVAYHAGAPWLRHPASFQAGLDFAAKMFADRHARLTAEVERLRSAIDFTAKCAHEGIATKAELAKLLKDALAREDGAS